MGMDDIILDRIAFGGVKELQEIYAEWCMINVCGLWIVLLIVYQSPCSNAGWWFDFFCLWWVSWVML